jgi:hypothetical protein
VIAGAFSKKFTLIKKLKQDEQITHSLDKQAWQLLVCYHRALSFLTGRATGPKRSPLETKLTNGGLKLW